MDYLTEEELFELQHQDEMDAMDEIDILNEIESQLNFPKTKVVNKTPTKPEEEKENIPVHISSKRKLSFSEESLTNLISSNADVQAVEDTQCSQSLIQEKSKRTLSDISDLTEDNSEYHSAKKTCHSVNEEFESFLNENLRSQARPSFFEEVRNFSKDQQMLTCSDGCRKYYSVKEEDNPEDLIPSFSQRTSSLLTTPIDVLKAQYFTMEEEELKRQSEDLPKTSSSMDTDVVEEKDTESSLWVEKYRPISYMHLLSEEGINRTLLQWLKLWDKVVFGKEKKVKKKPLAEKKNEFQNPKFQNSKFPNSKFQKKYGELIEELDEHGRPHHKVAFLCGPPGLGKTTLATIIARHAGYAVVEINASDDRSPEVFRKNLEAATQMKAVLHEDKRPNCLILDEIDGAPAPSINVLLSFIKSTGIPKGKRKKGDIPLLMRPIICICNDQYTPALKPLRQISLVLNFPPTTTPRLSSRLNEICLRESLTADMAALTLLCEKTSNDIRSCLSTLQFIQRMKRDLKMSDLEGLTVGQKDMQKNLFGVWQDIFYCTEKPSFDRTYQTVNSFGDYDKIYVGIFENYANIKFKYRNAHSVWDGADWLCFGDMIQQEISHSQSFFLMPYLPYPAVAFHMLFASNSYPKIAYPAAFYEYRSKSNQLSNTVISLVKDIISIMKCFLNLSLLLLDVFPFLVEIIKPSLRPVNTQLYSEREKSELKRVIELMLAFNLNYRQERMQDGTYSYILDPNLEELIRFSGIKSSKPLTYSTKQMIAREVEMEQMRKGEAAVDLKIASQQEKKSIKPAVVNKEPVVVNKEPVKKTTVADRPMLDFFGRKIIENPNAKKKAKSDPRDEEVWFHFKEGYSNAVRKTVYIKDLL